jgi:hypothetical protein
MKKLISILILILIILSLLMLGGCSKEPMRSVDGWARYYAIEEFESQTTHTAFATQIERYTVIPNVIIWEYQEVDGYKLELYKVVVVSDGGTEKTYHVMIGYKKNALHYFFTLKAIPEKNIIDYFIEEVE